MNKSQSKTHRSFTTGEAAIYCGVNFRTIIRWIEKGILNAYKLPGRGDHRIPEESLISFMRENQMPIPQDLLPAQSDRILVVDDDVPMAKAISRVLKQAGYKTDIAGNGFIAGSMMQKFVPSVITLDLKMPGLNGFDVLEYVRNEPTLSNTKILVVSAQPEIELKQAIKMGADDSLAKPFDNKELLAKVAQLMTSEQKRVNQI